MACCSCISARGQGFVVSWCLERGEVGCQHSTAQQAQPCVVAGVVVGCVCCMYQQVEGFLAVFYADHRGWCAGVFSARVAGFASPAHRLIAVSVSGCRRSASLLQQVWWVCGCDVCTSAMCLCGVSCFCGVCVCLEGVVLCLPSSPAVPLRWRSVCSGCGLHGLLGTDDI
jgi:hypothetical protein